MDGIGKSFWIFKSAINRRLARGLAKSLQLWDLLLDLEQSLHWDGPDDQRCVPSGVVTKGGHTVACIQLNFAVFWTDHDVADQFGFLNQQ
jgi:hypothetical protein